MRNFLVNQNWKSLPNVSVVAKILEIHLYRRDPGALMNSHLIYGLLKLDFSFTLESLILIRWRYALSTAQNGSYRQNWTMIILKGYLKVGVTLPLEKSVPPYCCNTFERQHFALGCQFSLFYHTSHNCQCICLKSSS